MKKSIMRIMSVVLCFAVLFCGNISVGATDSEVTRISCTVNGNAATQRGFCWYTGNDTPTEVVIYDAAGQDITSSLDVDVSSTPWEGNYSHKAVVSGLTSGSEYTYKVGSAAGWSDIGSFVTDDGDDEVNFVVVGDVQASDLDNFQSAAKVVDKAFETMPEATFYATLGDFTNDSDNGQWSDYGTAFEKINTNTTLVPITGNHDSNTGWFDNMFSLDTSESVQTNNGVNYSFDYGNTHIAVVNTNDMIAISDSQLTWLRNDMNSTSADWKIVLMHKAPYSLGKDGKWPDAQYLQESLAGVCDETGVDIVMSGHDHMYLRTKSLYDNSVAENNSGTTYVLSGTPGTKRYEIRDFAIDNFLPTEFVNTCVVQKTGYGNYFNGTDYKSIDETNIGGCFNTVSVSGGKLTLTSYIVCDADGSMKTIDTLVLEKEQGQNVPTYSGSNKTSRADYALDGITTIMHLAKYVFTVWLPRFLKAVPEIIYTYATTGTF